MSESGAAHLRRRGVRGDVEIQRNLVDAEVFHRGRPLPARPTAAVVVSSKLRGPGLLVVEEACRAAGVSCRVLGTPGPRVPQADVVSAMLDADIVIGTGRGVIEAMFCGRIPIVADPPAGDGRLTPDRVRIAARTNFSSRDAPLLLDGPTLAGEIGGYDPGDAPALRATAIELFEAKAGIRRLVSSYERLAALPATTLEPATRTAARFWAGASADARAWAADTERRNHAPVHAELARTRADLAALLLSHERLVRELGASHEAIEGLRVESERLHGALEAGDATLARANRRLLDADRRWLPGRLHQLRAWLARRLAGTSY